MPATDSPFANMRQLPEQVVAQWHGDPDEKPRYLQLMEANLAFNNARDALQVKRAVWAAEEKLLGEMSGAEDESFKLLVEAEQAVLRTQLRGLGLALVASAASAAVGALLGWVVAAVLVGAMLVAVGVLVWKTLRGYGAESAARELVRAASVKDREARTKAREQEQRAAEDHVRELQETARTETADAERGVRIHEKEAASAE